MGPPPAESTLRDVIARGADRGILLTDIRFAGADTLATSYALACAIRKLGHFDLIICGEKTVDGDTGQVGPELAEHLGIPHIAYVSEIRNVSEREIEVVSDFGEAYYLVKLKLPALITVTKDINVPRLPTFKDKMRARKAVIEKWSADKLSDICSINKFGFKGSPTVVHKVIIPKVTGRKGIIFRNGESVERLADIILEVVKHG